MFSKNFSRRVNNPISGLVAGTLIEGPNGWRPVEDLRIGDAVQSFDGGLARLVGLDRQWAMPARVDCLIHLPGGTLDNCSDLLLLPHQMLLVDTLGDENLPDAMIAMIPAVALDGVFGAIRRTLDKPVEVITPRFAEDEAIYVNSGTLLHCPGIRQVAAAASSDFFTLSDLAEARAFLKRNYGAPVAHPPYRRAA